MSEASDMARLVAWVEAETGLSFPEVHHATIRKAVASRCAELGLHAGAFEGLLRTDEAERRRFFSRIVIGETYFFRDERQFAALVGEVFPVLLREGRELRIWSATCATGEEAISAVAALLEAGSRLGLDAAWRVLATDINEEALARLRAGRFPPSSFRNDGRAFHPLLARCGAMEEDEWVADPGFLAKIETRHLNVLSDHPLTGPGFDLVLFRNTLVYMRPDKKERALARVLQAIRPGGYLFLASPEVPTVHHALLETLESGGSFYFRKLAAEAKPRLARSRSRAEATAGANDDAKVADRPGRRAVEQGMPELAQATRRQHGGHAKRRGFRPADIESGLALASRRLLDMKPREGPATARDDGSGSEAAREVASAVEAVLAALASGKHDLARDLLDSFEEGGGENHVGQYLRGLSMRIQGRLPEAVEYWERARTYERRFWPALFQAGLALDASDPVRARDLLRECLEAMEGQGEGQAYAILLDGFNSEYYRRMAERLLARARGR